jgi:hypothetical protein
LIPFIRACTAAALFVSAALTSGTQQAIAESPASPPSAAAEAPASARGITATPEAVSSCAISDLKPALPRQAPSRPSVKTITLVEETELYDDPTHLWTTGLLSPQTVEVTGDRTWISEDGIVKKWYSIRTWLGSKWILGNSALPGDMTPVSMDMLLTGEERLYEFQTDFMVSHAVISPQTVKVTGIWQGYYRIDTWLGDRWIAPVHNVLTGVEGMNTLMPASGPVELFTSPDPGCSSNSFYHEQNVYVMDKWNDWLRIRTDHGVYWTNPKLAVFDMFDPEGYLEAKVISAERTGSYTKLLLQARLTGKVKEWSRPMMIHPHFEFYDGEGSALAAGFGMPPIVFQSNEIKRFELTQSGDLTGFKLATISVFRVNETSTEAATASWNGYDFKLNLTDPKHPEVVAGDLKLAKAGAYTIVRGKVQVRLPDLNDLNASLTFYNDKNIPVGTARLRGTYGDKALHGHSTYRFETIAQGDMTAYHSVKLTVNSLNKPNQGGSK